VLASLQEGDSDRCRNALCGLVTTPDVRMRDEAKNAICSAPFLRILKVVRRQDRELVDHASQSLAQDETLQVLDNFLPGLVVFVWERVEGRLSREETVLYRDIKVGEVGDLGDHDGVGIVYGIMPDAGLRRWRPWWEVWTQRDKPSRTMLFGELLCGGVCLILNEAVVQRVNGLFV
jgi:hypothetical protein